MFSVASDPIAIRPEVLDYFFGFSITNTMTTAMLDTILLIVLMIFAARFSVKQPGKFQIFIEFVIEKLEGFIVNVAGNAAVAKKVTPLVASLIIFILISNLIILFLPFLSGITYNGIPMFRTHTTDYNTTLALAFVVVVLTQMYSIYTINIFNYIFRFFQVDKLIFAFRKGGRGFLVIIDMFIGVLDLISEFAKIISLSFRLFGNIFAGELLIGVIMGGFALFLPLPIMVLSLLSGVVHAVVFGALATSFFAAVLINNESQDNLNTV
jgi:F-type H+-transporting ATPase subunit a